MAPEKRHVSEIVRGERRQQLQTDIGRRRSMRDRVLAISLVVVRHEPVVFRADELLEKSPRRPRDLAERQPIRAAERGTALRERQTGRMNERRRQQPEIHDGDRQDEAQRIDVGNDRDEGCCNRRRRPHPPEDIRNRGGRLFDALGRYPLEQAPPRHEHPDQRSPDRVHHDGALMGQEGHRQERLTQADEDVVALCPHVLAPRDPGDVAAERSRDLDVRGERQDEQDDRRPEHRRSRQDRPAREQQQEQSGRQDAAAQVVEDLPARHDRQCVRHGAAARVRHRPPQPAGDLPVAANPPMLARGERQVVRRVVVDEVDIRAQTGACVEPFEQIVAEQVVLWNPVRERGVEDVHVVDAFPDVAAFVKKILVNVRNRRRVRVEADVAGEHARKRRPVRAHHTHFDSRLQDAVALRHPLQPRVEARAIQRVRERSDQAPCRFHRQLRVRVERDDVTNRRQDGEVAVADDEARGRAAAQELVELGELAALAFPAHPPPLTAVPPPLAMEQVEPVGSVPRVQLIDPAGRRVDQHVVAGKHLLARVGEVRQQGEVQVRVAVGEEADLQIVDERQQPRLGVHDRGYDHHGPIACRDAAAQIQLGQRPRLDLLRDDEVEEADDQLAHWNQRDERDDPEIRRGRAVPVCVREEAGDRQRCCARDRSEIADRRVSEHETGGALVPRRWIAEALFEPEPAARNEVVADVMLAVVLRRGPLRLARQLHGVACDVLLRFLRPLGELFDRMAVAVASGEVHSRVCVRRILAQDPLDQTDALEEQRPVDRRQQPHARDDVADRELIGRLPLLLDPQHLFRRIVLGFERALKRAPGGRRGRRLVAQPVEHLDDEWRRQPAVGPYLFAEQQLDEIRGVIAAFGERDAPAPHLVAAAIGGDDRLSQPAELLDERQPQHDRDRPDLADRKRRDALVGEREVLERLEVEPARGMCDQLAREHVHARIAFERSVCQLRKFEVVLAGKVLPDLPDLVADDVVVVAKPVLGSNGLRFGTGRRREDLI